MANFTFSGLDGYIAQLEKLRQSAEGITKKALYEGAGVVADEVRAAVESLPTDESFGTEKRLAKGIRQGQKEALARGLGVAPFQSEGDRIDTLVGFTGYSDYKTKKYPEGQPLALIARVAESGTSFSQKTPFMRKAIEAAEPKAKAEMKKTFETEIEQQMKG